MIQNVTLTRLFRSDKDKNGNPLMGKSGKPYTKLAIKCQEHGDKWLSGFGGAWNKDWKEGDEVKIEVVPNGQYLNFNRVDETKLLFDKVVAIEKYLKEVVKPIIDNNFTSDGKPVPTFNQVSPVKPIHPQTQGIPTQNIPDNDFGSFNEGEIDPEEISF